MTEVQETLYVQGVVVLKTALGPVSVPAVEKNIAGVVTPRVEYTATVRQRASVHGSVLAR